MESSAAVDSLFAKLDRAGLEPHDLAVLEAIVSAAEQLGEVEGFGLRPPPSAFGLPDLRGRVDGIIQSRAGIIIEFEDD